MRLAFVLAPTLALAMGCVSGPHTELVANDQRPPLLAALDGHWTMTGDVLGKPVEYALTVSPVLAGAFTELHMLDVATPPHYEARVFLGHDAKSGEIIAHWLDVFGGRASIPPGTGRMSGETIEVVVPYPDGPFRDTFTRDPLRNRWTLTIESSDPAGRWKHFAAYTIERSK